MKRNHYSLPKSETVDIFLDIRMPKPERYELVEKLRFYDPEAGFIDREQTVIRCDISIPKLKEFQKYYAIQSYSLLRKNENSGKI